MERTGVIGQRLVLVAAGGVGLTIAMAAVSGTDAVAAAELAGWACVAAGISGAAGAVAPGSALRPGCRRRHRMSMSRRVRRR